MKMLIASLLVMFSLSSFATEVVCSGKAQGKAVDFVLEKDAGSDVLRSFSLRVNGATVVSYPTQLIHVSSRAYGTLIDSTDPHSLRGIMLLFGRTSDGKKYVEGYLKHLDEVFNYDRAVKLKCSGI